jgi:hypothetical protein
VSGSFKPASLGRTPDAKIARSSIAPPRKSQTIEPNFKNPESGPMDEQNLPQSAGQLHKRTTQAMRVGLPIQHTPNLVQEEGNLDTDGRNATRAKLAPPIPVQDEGIGNPDSQLPAHDGRNDTNPNIPASEDRRNAKGPDASAAAGHLGHYSDASLFASPAGSNYLAAQRYASVTGKSTTGRSQEELWGPRVHSSMPEGVPPPGYGGFVPHYAHDTENITPNTLHHLSPGPSSVPLYPNVETGLPPPSAFPLGGGTAWTHLPQGG